MLFAFNFLFYFLMYGVEGGKVGLSPLSLSRITLICYILHVYHCLYIVIPGRLQSD